MITTKSFTCILIYSISIFYIFFFPSNLECKLAFYGYLFGKDGFICIIHIHFLFFMPGTFFQGFRLLHTKGLFLLHFNSSTSMWFMTFKSVSLCSIADPFKFWQNIAVHLKWMTIFCSRLCFLLAFIWVAARNII